MRRAAEVRPKPFPMWPAWPPAFGEPLEDPTAVAPGEQRLPGLVVQGESESQHEAVDVMATVTNLVSVLEETPIAGAAALDWSEHVSGLRNAWQRLDTLHMKLFDREEVLRSEDLGGGTTSREPGRGLHPRFAAHYLRRTPDRHTLSRWEPRREATGTPSQEQCSRHRHPGRCVSA